MRARTGLPQRRDQGATGVAGAREHLPTELLDAVRGLAALYVVLFHARLLLLIGEAPGGPHQALALATALTKHGHAAVLAFFLVSGYAIHYRQAHRLARGDVPVVTWRAYAWHRIRRLYPPLCAALLLTAVLDTIGAHINPGFYAGNVPAEARIVVPQPLSVEALLGTLLFGQGIVTPIFGTDGPLWSLAYEGFFYLAYPLMLALNRRLGPVRCLAVFVGVGLGCAAAMSFGVRAGLLSLVAYWPAWVAGAFIADARAGRVRLPARWWTAALLSPLLLGGLVLVRRATAGDALADLAGDALWVGAFFGPLGWLAAGRHSPVVRSRVRRLGEPLLGVGAMSYSLYVAHMPVLALASALWLARNPTLPASPWLLLAGIGLALATALGVYRVAERPVLAARRPRPSPGRSVARAAGAPGLLPSASD